MSALQRVAGRLASSLPVRAWQRYGTSRGNVLAGGVAYFAFFSVLPALAVGFTVFGLVLGDNEQLQKRVVGYVNDALGTTVIGTEAGPGVLVTVDQLTQSSVLSVTGAIGLLTLLLGGLGWLGATREGIRAMFGQPTFAGNIVLTKVRDVGVLATLGVAVLVSVVAAFLVNATTAQVLGWVGLSGSRLGGVLLTVIGALVVLVLDTGVFLILMRLLGGVRLPLPDLASGAWVGGAGLGVLKIFGALLLARTGGNKLLAAFGVAVGLLIWMNLVGRLVLLAAAWSATVADDRGHIPLPDEEVELEPDAAGSRARALARAVPVPVAPAGRVDGSTPSYGQRAGDRTAVAAGVVLGATGAVATRVAAGGVRALVGAVRNRRDGG